MIVDMVILENLVFVVIDVNLINFGMGKNVFVLRVILLWMMEFVENVLITKNITIKQIHVNVRKDSIG